MSDPSLDHLDNGGNFDDVDEEVTAGRFVAEDVSCENCEHKQVCAVYSGIEPMFQQWIQGEEPPIDLNELAVICGAYLPKDD